MPAFAEFIDRLIAALRQPLTAEMLPGLAAAPFAGLPWPPPQPEPGEGDAALATIAAAIRELPDPFQAGRLCVLAGAFVEQGAPASSIAGAVAERTRSTFALARRLVEQVDPEQQGSADPASYFAAYPAEVAAYLGAQFTGLAAMTTLCRDVTARSAARDLVGLSDDAAYLQDVVPSGYYLSELLACVDDFTLDVIHPEQRRGYRLLAEGVRNNFHLFTLLQGALIGDPAAGWLAGPEPNRELVDFARGRAEHPQADSDQAVWTFSNWPAWLGREVSQLPGYWIWGEGSPRDILPFRGMPTVLLSPLAIGGRSWGIGFCSPLHGAHRAELRIVRHLDSAEVERLLAAIAAESA